MVGKRAVSFWAYIEFIVAKRSHPTNQEMVGKHGGQAGGEIWG